MPLEILVDTTARVLRVLYSGEVDMDDRRIFARQVLERAQATGIDLWLLDFRRAQSRGADPADVRDMADEMTPQLRPGVRIAYLLTYDHQLDDALEVLVRSRGVPVERFHTSEAALAWLHAGGDEVAVADADVQPVESSAMDRAFRLAAEAIDPSARVSPDQFAALGELVHELLEKGIDEATAMQLASRMSAAMDNQPRH